MPNQRHDRRYDTKAFEIWSQDPRTSDMRVVVQLQEWACEQAEKGAALSTNPPSARTVTRIRAEWKALKPDVERQYQKAHWPETMLHGALPWEASAALLEQLRLRAHRGLPRPTVRGSLWFWRLTLAAPDADAASRDLIASHLATFDALGDIPLDEARRAEGLLLYQGWTPEGHRAYQTAGPRATYDRMMQQHSAEKEDASLTGRLAAEARFLQEQLRGEHRWAEEDDTNGDEARE